MTVVFDGNVGGRCRGSGYRIGARAAAGGFVVVPVAVGEVAVVGVGVAEGVAEAIDGLVLEAKTDVGVGGGGDVDVGVAEELLDGP